MKRLGKFLLHIVGIVIISVLFHEEIYAATPVNSDATVEARILLNYLEDVSGAYTLSGQHDKPSYPTEVYNRVYEITGSYPAVWSGDFGFMDGPNDTIYNRDELVKNAIEKWNNGSIPMLSWHMIRPDMEEPNEWIPGVHNDATSETYPPFTDAQLDEMTTAGTELYNRFIERIDSVVPYFQRLQDENVPVLWRPFHEINGNWFWWGGNATYSKKLYQVMYERYVNYWGLNNLIWVWCVDRPLYSTTLGSVYPGDQYVDVLGMDIYDRDFNQNYYDQLLNLANGKPIALSEVGELPAQQILEQQSKWAFFVCWTEYLEGNNTQQEIKHLYWSNQVLTREETNDFLTTTPPSVGQTNLAADSSSIIEVSSSYDVYGGGLATDEDYQSAWKASEAADQYIMVHLEEEKALSQIKIYWGNTYPIQYQLQISHDGINFETVYSNTTSSGGEQRIMLDGIKAKDIKIYSWEAAGMEVREIEIYSFNETDTGSLNVLREGMTAELIAGVVSGENGEYAANSGDILSAYKVVAVSYNKSFNSIDYEFTDVFKAFLNSDPVWTGLSIEAYTKLLNQEEITDEEGQRSLEQLLGAFSAYCEASNAEPYDTANVDEAGIVSFGQVPMGQYIILGQGKSMGSKVYQTVTANVVPVIEQDVYKLYERYVVKLKTKEASLIKDITGGTVVDEGRHTAGTGDEVIYRITIPLVSFAYPEGATNKTIYVTDVLEDGLEYISAAQEFEVKGYAEEPLDGVLGVLLQYDVAYTVSLEPGAEEQNKGGTAYIDFVYDEISDYQYITISYSARLTEAASVGTADGNENTAELVYSNTPFQGTTWDADSGDVRPTGNTQGYYSYSDTESVYTYAIVVDKYDAFNYSKKLENAEFAIYKEVNGEKNLLRENLRTDKCGQLIISGLGAGQYILEETSAPDGYKQYEQEIEVTLNGTIADYTKEVQKITEQKAYTYTINATDEDGNARIPATDGAGRQLYYTSADEYSYLTLTNTGNLAYIKEESVIVIPETEVVVIRKSDVGEGKGYYPVAVSNVRIMELPDAGGKGNTFFYLVGIILILTGVFLWIFKKMNLSRGGIQGLMSLLCVFVLIGGNVSRVYAAEYQKDHGIGSIELILDEIGTEPGQSSFLLYQVGEYKADSKIFVLKEEYQHSGVDLNQLSLASDIISAIEVLEKIAYSQAVLCSQQADVSGKVLFDYLDNGVYLIIQGERGNYGKVSPALVWLPTKTIAEQGEEAYCLSIKVKGEFSETFLNSDFIVNTRDKYAISYALSIVFFGLFFIGLSYVRKLKPNNEC